MPIALAAADGSGAPVSLRDIDASGNEFVYTTCRLAFSGSYTTGATGDTLDLTPLLAAGVPSGFAPFSGYVEGNGDNSSQGGNGGYYTLSLYNANPAVANALTANKVRVWSAGGGELGSGAYPAAVLRDAVTLNLIWRKFQ